MLDPGRDGTCDAAGSTRRGWIAPPPDRDRDGSPDSADNGVAANADQQGRRRWHRRRLRREQRRTPAGARQARASARTISRDNPDPQGQYVRAAQRGRRIPIAGTNRRNQGRRANHHRVGQAGRQRHAAGQLSRRSSNCARGPRTREGGRNRHRARRPGVPEIVLADESASGQAAQADTVSPAHRTWPRPWRTVGCASVTTVTNWNSRGSTQDRCDGTLTTVIKGHASVMLTGQTNRVKAGKRYLAAMFAAKQRRATAGPRRRAPGSSAGGTAPRPPAGQPGHRPWRPHRRDPLRRAGAFCRGPGKELAVLKPAIPAEEGPWGCLHGRMMCKSTRRCAGGRVGDQSSHGGDRKTARTYLVGAGAGQAASAPQSVRNCSARTSRRASAVLRAHGRQRVVSRARRRRGSSVPSDVGARVALRLELRLVVWSVSTVAAWRPIARRTAGSCATGESASLFERRPRHTPARRPARAERRSDRLSASGLVGFWSGGRAAVHAGSAVDRAARGPYLGACGRDGACRTRSASGARGVAAFAGARRPGELGWGNGERVGAPRTSSAGKRRGPRPPSTNALPARAHFSPRCHRADFARGSG